MKYLQEPETEQSSKASIEDNPYLGKLMTAITNEDTERVKQLAFVDR